ncbi:DUF4249 domain-containing protein [Aridibaculum aurantiacum]|uniref:DUF4249 domain-containing protein n=1 Tax=Aridibaculum aurantiacum TaxID=2810307 RepID=UPI001A96AB38|nr:DUF4249 domain-containing protein [Aridibaculum aurantiacum]
MKNTFWLFLLSVMAISCEKTINVQPEIQEPLLVVDGIIEDGQPPYVILSKSINYFSSFSPDVVAASVVRGANLTLNDGTRTVNLKEYHVPVLGLYTLTYYSTDTTNAALNMLGEQEKTYTLSIGVDNRSYTSTTTIPKLTKTIDSLWHEPTRFSDTSRVWLMAKITDPPGLGNYIRYYTSTNNGNFLPGDNSVHDDQVVDGTTYNVTVEQGKDRNNGEGHRRSFGRGDTVTVKFANIDKATYDFWRTLEFGYQSVGNPFASPVRVLGNVNNGALGAFCGYAVQYISLIIPK